MNRKYVTEFMKGPTKSQVIDVADVALFWTPEASSLHD